MGSRPGSLDADDTAVLPSQRGPGSSFTEVLRRSGRAELDDLPPTSHRGPTAPRVVAIRYVDGVVMAGDRRATSGNLIAHRTMEKVFPADRHSGVAIAGAADSAVEMVKLFQLQLEHYEKVENAGARSRARPTSWARWSAATCPLAMQGFVVVPLFAGYDTRRSHGRLFEYDVTGGRYEEQDFAATGSGSLHAGTVVKMGRRRPRPHRHHRPGHQRPVPGGRRRLRHRRISTRSGASTR